MAILLRRFYLSAPVIAGAVLGAQLLIHSIAPEYRATAQLLLALFGPGHAIRVVAAPSSIAADCSRDVTSSSP